MTIVAAAGCITRGLLHRSPTLRILSNTAIVIAAALTASVVHHALGGEIGHFTWPWHGVPIASAVAAYCFVTRGLPEILPLIKKQRIDHWKPSVLLRDCPTYFIWAAL